MKSNLQESDSDSANADAKFACNQRGFLFILQISTAICISVASGYGSLPASATSCVRLQGWIAHGPVRSSKPARGSRDALNSQVQAWSDGNQLAPRQQQPGQRLHIQMTGLLSTSRCRRSRLHHSPFRTPSRKAGPKFLRNRPSTNQNPFVVDVPPRPLRDQPNTQRFRGQTANKKIITGNKGGNLGTTIAETSAPLLSFSMSH